MKKNFLTPLFAAAAVILFLIALTFSGQARAQISSTTISFGVNATLKADAAQYLAIPSCSISAKCVAQLQLCNLDAKGNADSTRCVFISAGGQAPWNTNLWIGVSQSTKTSTGTVSTVPYGFGTLSVSVPNNEINVVR